MLVQPLCERRIEGAVPGCRVGQASLRLAGGSHGGEQDACRLAGSFGTVILWRRFTALGPSLGTDLKTRPTAGRAAGRRYRRGASGCLAGNSLAGGGGAARAEDADAERQEGIRTPAAVGSDRPNRPPKLVCRSHLEKPGTAVENLPDGWPSVMAVVITGTTQKSQPHPLR